MNANDLYFGGTFNPPHTTHVACARAAAKACGLRGVVLVPTGRPNLKDPRDVAPPADRLAMARLAAEDATHADPACPFAVNDLEVARGGVTYTIDTVETLRARGLAVVNWLIGADQLRQLHHWRRWTIYCGRRPSG